jgi:hypothetical protein
MNTIQPTLSFPPQPESNSFSEPNYIAILQKMALTLISAQRQSKQKLADQAHALKKEVKLLTDEGAGHQRSIGNLALISAVAAIVFSVAAGIYLSENAAKLAGDQTPRALDIFSSRQQAEMGRKNGNVQLLHTDLSSLTQQKENSSAEQALDNLLRTASDLVKAST